MKFVKKLGIAQLPVLIGLLIMMVALPVASNLVQEEQDTRDKAASGKYYFCLRRTSTYGGIEVVYRDSGKYSLAECNQYAKSYINPDTGLNEFDRGNIGFCTTDPNQCNSTLLNLYAKCNNAVCGYSEDKHFSTESCTKALQYYVINKLGRAVTEKDRCFDTVQSCKSSNLCEEEEEEDISWYYCDGNQLTCKAYSIEYTSAEACSQAHGGRTCYPADAKVYCDSVCAKADYMYYCGSSGCEKSDEKFVSLTECNNVVGKDCFETLSDCEKKCDSVPIDTSCTDYEGNKINNNLKGCSKPDLISTCRNGKWSNASGDFASCKSDEKCSDGVCLKVYCYGNDGKPTTINTTGCVTESSLATCQIDSTTRVAKWVGQQACNYGCENGQCKEKPIVDPCDGKNCSWGCVNGKCKCNINGTNYLSGERACHTGNKAVNECNDGNWKYSVDVCETNEICKDGQCVKDDIKTCQNWDKTVVSVGYSGCPERQAVGYCTINGWFGQSACGTGRVCVNGKCVTDSQPKNCTSDTGQIITAGSTTRFCYNGSVHQCDVSGNYIPRDLCMYGCVNGVCQPQSSLIQCTDHYGKKVNPNFAGCVGVAQVSKCLNTGQWSIKSADIINCGVDERCLNGQCQKIYCYGAETVSPNATACNTTFSLAVCRRNPTTGVAEWGSEDPCESGECRNGGCVNEEKKCTQCTTSVGNRTRGDADCDGKVTLNDWALWFKEFESGKGTEQKKTWFADFTCDGKVKNDDLDIWFTNYLIDQRK